MAILINPNPLFLYPVFRQTGLLIEYKPFESFYQWSPFLDLTEVGGGAPATGYGRIFGDEFVAGGVATYDEGIYTVFPYNILVGFAGLTGIAAGFINLREGLYRIKARLVSGDSLGIVTVKMNETDIATDVDLYSEANNFNYVLTYEDVVVPAAGDQVFSFVITGKNELSTDYRITISKVNFWRTGDLP